MKFINKEGQPFFFIHLGSKMNVQPEGIELSNTNRELLLTAIRDERLQVVDEDKPQADMILASFDQSLGGTKQEASTAEETPFSVKFHNDTDHEIFVVANGSKHFVGADQDITLSGNNKELVAAALNTDGLRLLSDKKKVVVAAKIASKKKDEEEKTKLEDARVPQPPQLPRVQLTPEEEQQQQQSLTTALSSNPGNNPQLMNEKEVSQDLAGELEKGIVPNAPGNEPANGLRVV